MPINSKIPKIAWRDKIFESLIQAAIQSWRSIRKNVEKITYNYKQQTNKQ